MRESTKDTIIEELASSLQQRDGEITRLVEELVRLKNTIYQAAICLQGCGSPDSGRFFDEAKKK